MSAIALYAALVALAVVAFYCLRQGVPEGSPARYAYAVCGPALSLFTHMSYMLFGIQTLFVLPWLVLGAMLPSQKRIFAAVFCLLWLGIGWYMHDLF